MLVSFLICQNRQLFCLFVRKDINERKCFMHESSSLLPTHRIRSLDIIRGIALFGILLINVHFFMVTDIFNVPEEVIPADTLLGQTISVFVEKKFYSIFSFLFGVGFFIFATKAESKGWKPLRLFSRRLFILFVIGLFHLYFFLGSILSMYALIALFLLPFYRRTVPVIMSWWSIIFALYTLSYIGQIVASPQWYFFLFGNDAIIIWLMFLAGLLYGKLGFLKEDQTSDRRLRTVQRTTFPIFVIGVIVLYVLYVGYGWSNTAIDAYLGLFAIPMTFFYIATLFLVLRQTDVVERLQPIGYVGQMAFTNYLLQNVIGVALITAFGNPTSIGLLTLIALLIYMIQIVYSVIYFKYFKIGPLESIWRRLTYGRRYRHHTFSK